MSARSKARKRALDVLFSADVLDQPLEAAVDVAKTRAASEPERASSWPYAREILVGVLDNAPEIDARIQAQARGWRLERMPAVDRGLLRIAVWELLHNPEVPAGVAVSEAVESAKTLSTEDSGRFIGGILSAIAAEDGRNAGAQ